VVARLVVEPPGPDREPVAGVLYDALAQRDFTLAMVRAIARGARSSRGGGTLLAQPLPALAELHPPDTPFPDPVVLEVERGHTSVAYGDQLHLKVFRYLDEGVNPALELGRFLAERTDFRNVPPLAGSIEYRPQQGGPRTLAVLEGFVANQGDAWHHFRDMLVRYYEQALARPESGRELPLSLQPLPELAEGDLPPAAVELLGQALEPTRLLAQRTAEFHRALAADAGDPDFAPEPFTSLYQRSLYQSVRSQTLRGLQTLRRRLRSLPEGWHGLARQVLEREPELMALARRIMEQKVTSLRTRNHGDYHLKRVLYTGKDFVIIDLEGNPQRPLSDRRRKRSSLRDVACMLRSFHYVTVAALHRGGIRPEDVPALEPWRQFWHLWVSVAFLKAYLGAIGDAPFLTRNPAELHTLLTFYLLKRTAVELRDDALHHPERIQVPLEGLLQLLDVAR
jgi:maltose alpha-D-glucosyltransferase/alpha-amylase